MNTFKRLANLLEGGTPLEKALRKIKELVLDGLDIYHDGSGWVKNTVGSLYISNTQISGETRFQNNDSSGTAKYTLRLGGAIPYARLYYDGAERFHTISGGYETGAFSTSGASRGTDTISEVTRSSANITTDTKHRRFYNPNGQVGWITTIGTATTYSTSSDKRLKTSHGLLTNASELVNKIEIHEYHFNADPSLTLHGVMAQDCIKVYPNAISHEEDNWGADYSKLVPIMLANIQDLNKQVKELKNVISRSP